MEIPRALERRKPSWVAASITRLTTITERRRKRPDLREADASSIKSMNNLTRRYMTGRVRFEIS